MSDASRSTTASPSLREAQRAFFSGLRRDDGSAPNVLQDESGLGPEARYSIYRTAYRMRLVSVLRSDHPTLVRCLGERFDAMATAYALTQPSRVRSLRDFGDGFPDLIGDSVEADAQPTMALARFERTLLDVFDAPDRPLIGLDALETLGRSGATLCGLLLHPSVRVREPGWNVVAQWHASRAGEAPLPWSPDNTVWLLWRSADRLTCFRAVGTAEAALVRAALDGADMAKMCTLLANQIPPADVPAFVAQTIRAWLTDGLLCELRTEEGPRDCGGDPAHD